MRISDWSSDVCSSDLGGLHLPGGGDTFLSAIYVDNLVDVIVSALSAQDVAARAFYLADPEVLHVRELFRMWSEAADRKSVVSGKSVSVRVDLGGRRIIKNKRQ